MSTLLDNAVFAHPHQLSERTLERLSCVETAMTAGPPNVPNNTSDSQWQMLSQMASQHHMSDYSRLKFGPRGCSTRYVPLCMHTPDVYNELQLRQMSYNEGQVWWYSDPHFEGNCTPPSTDSPLPETRLAHELSNAMGESLPCTADCPPIHGFSRMHLLKTSATHPINVSSIIPPDAVALISSHVLLASCRPGCACNYDSSIPNCGSSSTICEIPPSFTLDRFICAETGVSAPSIHPDSSPSTVPLRPRSPGSIAVSHLRTRSHVSQALQAAMSSGFQSSSSALPGIGTLSVNVSGPSSEVVLDKDNMTSTTIHSNHSSVSLSLSVTVSTSTPAITPKSSYCVDVASISNSAPDHSFHDPTYAGQPAFNMIIPSDPTSKSSSSFALGNLFLSSCPGKKVRLQGPVKGRSGVCRDLETDLRRMKDMGVGCIVCCLDDTELEFLGSPWAEYQRLAQMLGLDVVRLPTPEGLAPSINPAALDKHLTLLIQQYTLCGIPVLVHCRGGVGRAGVVACCWMIRLGLFGSLPGFSESDSAGSWAPRNDIYPCDLKTLEIVQKAIDVVRRRRSMKAIETYEQVKFLADYVDFLRTAS
ncbi:phosphatases II [Hymenopellis radicata]|nr:phosphatases II [Hymenopellis radicata]